MITQSKKEDFQLLLTVINSEVTSLNNESTILFEIEMISEITKKDWKVSRTIFDIKTLYKTLKKSYLSIPDISSILNINLHKFSSSRDMAIIRLSIQNFLNELIDRADLINSSHVKTFLELDNHQEDFMQYQPLLLNELAESMEISDFQYNTGHSLLFVGTAYSADTGTISSYVSSFSSLWNSTLLGGIAVYHVAKTNYEEIMVDKLYEQSLPSQVNKIAFFEGDSIDILAVGLHDGSVLLYRVDPSQTNINSTKTELIDQFSRIKPHNHPILDFGIEADFGYVYTAAVNEKSIAISEINYQTVIKKVQVSGNSISCFKYDKESKRIIVIDVANSIWIMQVANYINIQPIQAFHGQTSLIRCISIEQDLNFFFTGSDKGVITIYEYNDNDSKTKFSLNKKLDLKTGVKVTNVKYKQSKHEVISAFSNGSVAFWTHYEDNPEFVLDCHEKKVTKIQYEESSKLLITASTDKTLKLWHLPEYWPSEAMRRDKQTNDRFFLDDYLETTASTHQNMSKLQDALKNFGNENIFNEENSLRKTSKENRESMNILAENEKDCIGGDVEENTENFEQNENSENSLDGWDDEIVERNPQNRFKINSSINDLFLI